LRDLIDLHGNERAGANYLEQLMEAPALKQMRDRAINEGESASDSRIVLDYAFLPQLNDAIVKRAGWFYDGCVPAIDVFKAVMIRLNSVRRKVAHHRLIEQGDLEICAETQRVVLSPVGTHHPDLAADFLVDRWEAEVARTVATLQSDFGKASIPEEGKGSEQERRAQLVAALETQLGAVEAVILALNRLTVPAQRLQLHEAAMAAVERWRAAISGLLDAARKPDLSIPDAERARTDYSTALNEVAELRRRIQSLRAGMPG
jgi:hypothetical protein